MGSSRSKVKVSSRSCLGMVERGCLAIFIIFALLIPLGLVYQSTALRRDAQQYPPPGQLVDVGGFRLHLYCTGSGSPTVVLEAGLGDGSFIWGRVQPAIAQHTRVCSYDRPGLGWSDFVSQPFRRQAIAENLHRLLVQASIPGPYILVGHSIGGIYIRAFTQKYPKEVAGLVFVDSSHENQTSRLEMRGMSASRLLDVMLSVCDLLAPTGLFRLVGVSNALIEGTGLPTDLQAAAIATLNRNDYCRTVANEMRTSDKDTNLRLGPPSLGDIPLIVLVAGGYPEVNQQGRSPDSERMGWREWLTIQDELSALSTQGKLLIVENSSHYIHLDRPEAVIEAILEILAKVRSANG